MNRSSAFTLTESPTRWFSTSAGPMVARAFFADRHRGWRRESNKNRKGGVFRLGSSAPFVVVSPFEDTLALLTETELSTSRLPFPPGPFAPSDGRRNSDWSATH